MKKQKGITLIGLVVTIIILLILAGVTVMTLTGDNGLLTKAGETKNTSEKGEIEEQIKLAYNEWKLKKETGEITELKYVEENRLRQKYGDNATVNKQGKSIIINVKGYEFTLVDDGTMEEGKLAYLDIADGNIDLYSNGYKQYTGNLQGLNKNGATAYTGKYIITGTTTENVVRVCDEGTFDLTIKNLNIDVSEKSRTCAFNANRGGRQTGCYVKTTLEGKNNLSGGSAPGLGFTNATPNVNGVTNGSTLTIEGNGYLVAKASGYSAAIGAGYTGFESSAGQVSNIIINSGNITADQTGGHGTGIGGGLYGKVNNIIINGGNIIAKGAGYGAGIGTAYSSADNIKINGGNINSNGISGGYNGTIGRVEINGGNINVSNSYGQGAIGSYNLSQSGLIKITGGNINATSSIGDKIQNIVIEGGVLNIVSTSRSGICCKEGGSISITGGNILARGNNNLNIATYEEETSNLVAYTPTNGSSNIYETPIKLDGVAEGKQITKLTTSDNIEYGIKDMYTLEDGMLYLYLPTGTRTITITTEDGKTYSGTVETKETSETATLTQIN